MLVRGLVYIPLPSSFCEDIKRYKRLIKPVISPIHTKPLHCTLMAGRFYDGSRDDIVKSLEEIVIESFPIELGKTGLSEGVYSEDTIITLVVPSQALHDLHVMVITKLQEYIDHDNTPPLSKRYRHNPGRKESYLKYGNPHYGEFYIPHIAVAIVNKGTFIKRKYQLPKHKFLGETWEVDTFCLSTSSGDVTTDSFKLTHHPRIKL
ncbi:MAG: 2'-5' RNA ligase family protein [Nanoarchaeota archaeon]